MGDSYLTLTLTLIQGREVCLEEFKLEIASSLPQGFKTDARGLIAHWGNVELTSQGHDARDLVTMDGDSDESVLVKDEEVKILRKS